MSQTKTYIEISGMTCPACEKLITKRLTRIGDITKIKVSVKDEIAEVESARKISDAEIKEVLKGTQYKVINIH